MLKSSKDLSQVSGGSIFNAPREIAGDKEYHYEVINDKGNVLAKFNSLYRAREYANINDLNDREISWEEVLNRRNANENQ